METPVEAPLRRHLQPIFVLNRPGTPVSPDLPISIISNPDQKNFLSPATAFHRFKDEANNGRPLSRMLAEADAGEDSEEEAGPSKRTRKRTRRTIGFAGVVKMTRVQEAAQNPHIVSFLERYREKKRLREHRASLGDMEEIPSSSTQTDERDERSKRTWTQAVLDRAHSAQAASAAAAAAAPRPSAYSLGWFALTSPLSSLPTPGDTLRGEMLSQITIQSEIWRTGLGILFLGAWTMTGILAFSSIEAPAEATRLAAAQIRIDRRSNVSADKLFKLIQECRDNCSMAAATEAVDNCTKMDCPKECERDCAMVFLRAELGMVQRDPIAWRDLNQTWTRDGFLNAFSYCVSVYTTIGYGNVVCYTFYGRLFTILYALVGIPSCFLVLGGIGRPILSAVQRLMYLLMDLKIRLRYFFCSNRIDPFKSGRRKRLSQDEFPLPLALCLLGVYLFGSSALLYASQDGWEFFSALYFNFISLSTIGFGDVMPWNDSAKIITLTSLFLGLAIVGMCISVIQESLEDKYMDAMNLMEEAYEIGSGIVEDLSSYWESDSEAQPDIELADRQPPATPTKKK